MKKIYSLLLLFLALSPAVILPPIAVAESSTQAASAEETDLPPIKFESVIPQNAAVAVNAFNGLSLSAFATAAGGGTLSAGLLSSAIATVVAPAILGIGLGYSFYQLGQALGASSQDLAQTNQNLSGYFASSPKARQELDRFIVSGVDSTTNSYDFSASLQETYAKNTLGYTLMSEYLTGTSDHGVYQFSRPTASWQRKMITYNVRWSLEKENCLIVRDARAEASGQEDTFYVLESFWLEEADHDPSKTRFSLAGEQLDASGVGKSVVKEEFWDISMETLLAQIQTVEDYLTFIRQNTTYEFGAIDVPSQAVARQTAVTMAKEYEKRQHEMTENLNQLVASSNGGMQFDPSGLMATLFGLAVTATLSGDFIYTATQEVVPTYLWPSIEFSYSEDAIPYDDSVTIDGKRGELDPETGDIVDKDGNILKEKALGSAWTLAKYTALVQQLKKWNDDETEWYTPVDLIFDEYLKEGKNKGHTISQHIGKDEKFLRERLDDPEIDITEATTFYEFLMPLLMINAGIFTAKKYLNGNAGIPGVDVVVGLLGKAEVIKNNRVRFTSKENILPDIVYTGWGIQRVKGEEDTLHTEIPDALVLIQRKGHVIRKKRKYFIVTAYPEIR